MQAAEAFKIWTSWKLLVVRAISVWGSLRQGLAIFPLLTCSVATLIDFRTDLGSIERSSTRLVIVILKGYWSQGIFSFYHVIGILQLYYFQYSRGFYLTC